MKTSLKSYLRQFQVLRPKLGRYLGGGAYKSVYAIVGNPHLVFVKACDRLTPVGHMIAYEQQDLAKLRRLGIPAARYAKIGRYKQGRNWYACGIMKRYAAGNRPENAVDGTPAFKKFLNIQSMNMLDRILLRMIERKVFIDDLQFLITKSGKIVVADPLAVIPDDKVPLEDILLITGLKRTAAEIVTNTI